MSAEAANVIGQVAELEELRRELPPRLVPLMPGLFVRLMPSQVN